ncbi:hypothetical protein GCM10023184_35200 [Flaviaesturariibacter amylovorans]|uniref:Uncharacterized protein n=1 Tax=Flaviaesturariibacter amylovorans TaxID=1084520 RepID=A0ABP8HFG9_9BACT
MKREWGRVTGRAMWRKAPIPFAVGGTGSPKGGKLIGGSIISERCHDAPDDECIPEGPCARSVIHECIPGVCAKGFAAGARDARYPKIIWYSCA